VNREYIPKGVVIVNKNIKVVCFDADDTMWVNEPYYREIEQKFCVLMEKHVAKEVCDKELLRIEFGNLDLYGYGAKSFTLSMIETAIELSKNTISAFEINHIMELGKELINKPVILLDGIEAVLQKLKNDYQLIVATKGDLLDQERKLKNSGLEKYFHHIEIMSEKDHINYQKLIAHLDSKPEGFLMIGNSIKSDILPVLEIGASAIHIPCETTWAHEHVEDFDITTNKFKEIKTLTEIPDILKG